eukprot:2223174-Prorocentrum_lima.AAC.1
MKTWSAFTFARLACLQHPLGPLQLSFLTPRSGNCGPAPCKSCNGSRSIRAIRIADEVACFRCKRGTL